MQPRDIGPAHGYAVIASLRERSRGAFDPPEETVYPALHRLERDGLIESEWDARAPPRRRVYQLTTAGAKAQAAKRPGLAGVRARHAGHSRLRRGAGVRMSEIERYLDEFFDRLAGQGAAGRRALAEAEDHLQWWRHQVPVVLPGCKRAVAS